MLQSFILFKNKVANKRWPEWVLNYFCEWLYELSIRHSQEGVQSQFKVECEHK